MKWLMILLAVAFLGCATNIKNLRRVSLGYTKAEVENTLGEPRAVRGAIRNKFDQVVEVWEYRLAVPNDDNVGTIVGKSIGTFITLGLAASEFRGKREDYWFYFVNDELVQWGKAGDWQREADRIYEVRFQKGPTLEK